MISSVEYILFGFAALCLIFELSGSKRGHHKIGDRYYILLTAILGVIAAGYYLPVTLDTSACLLFTLLGLGMAGSQLVHSELELGEAYALILVHCAFTLRLLASTHWLNIVVLLAFSNIVLIGLTYFRRNKRHVAEIGIKYLLVSFFVLCLMSIAIALSISGNVKLSLAFFWIALLLLMGVTPFFNAHIDFLTAGPGFSSVLLVATCIMGGSNIARTLVTEKFNPNLEQILFVFGSISLIIPYALAFDQQRIARLVAYLIFGQSGLALLLALTHVSSMSIMYLHLALVVPGILAGIRFWKHSQNSDKNWEDYAGAGRKHPYVATTWLYSLASLVGAPFTPGFWIYLELAHRAERLELYWIFALIVCSIALGMFPIVRLTVFMFGKPTHHEMMRMHEPRQAFLIIGCALAAATSYIVLELSPTIYEGLFK